jgi:hypothetical protein
MRKLSQLVRVAAVRTLAIGVTAAVVPLASAAAAHPAAGRAGRGGRAAAAGPSVNRTGYITISGGVKLAYDLTLPSATGRFPVALEYNDYTAGADNGAHQAGSDAGDLLAAGFAVLGVNQPGSGCSGGVNNIADVADWGRAGTQVVQWAARQPWSTGHLGTQRPSGAVQRHRLHRPVPGVGSRARPHPRRHRQSAAARMPHRHRRTVPAQPGTRTIRPPDHTRHPVLTSDTHPEPAPLMPPPRT